MREIEIYNGSLPFCSFDASSQFRILNEKILEDEILLDQIERNFRLGKSNSELELYKARLNHNINLLKLYELIIHEFFFSAQNGGDKGIAQNDIAEMRKKGWLICKTDYSLTNNDDYRFGKSNVEKKYQDFFFLMFENVFPLNLELLEDLRITKYYQEGIFCFNNKKYYACVCSLFPVIENIHKALTGFCGMRIYKIRDQLNKVNKAVDKATKQFKEESKYYIELVEQMNDLINNHYFATTIDNISEPEIICRNRIMHGNFSREISEKDCLQLFCTINTMYSLFILINSENQIKRIALVIEGLQKKVKELEEKGNVG